MFIISQALCYALVTTMNRTKSLTLKNGKPSAKDKYKEIHYVVNKVSVVRDMIRCYGSPDERATHSVRGIREGLMSNTLGLAFT